MSAQPPDWKSLREKWEASVTTGVTITDFARANGVTRESISRRMAKDAKAGAPWTPPCKKPASPDRSNVVDLHSRRGASGPKSVGGARNVTRDPRREFTRALRGDDGGGGLRLDDDCAPPLPGEDALDNDLASHGALSGLLLTAARGMLRRLIAGDIEPGMNQSSADVFNATISGVDRAVKLSRTVAGKKAGDASDDGLDADSPSRGIQISHVLLKPERIPVDEKGRQISA